MITTFPIISATWCYIVCRICSDWSIKWGVVGGSRIQRCLSCSVPIWREGGLQLGGTGGFSALELMHNLLLMLLWCLASLCQVARVHPSQVLMRLFVFFMLGFRPHSGIFRRLVVAFLLSHLLLQLNESLPSRHRLFGHISNFFILYKIEF